MEEVLNGYVTNPNPTPTLTLTSTLTLTLTELIKKSQKKRLYKIDRAVCWMEKIANRVYVVFPLAESYCKLIVAVFLPRKSNQSQKD
jgi:hypothetical protein